MNKFRVHVVSLVLLFGLSSICAHANHKGINRSQSSASQAAPLLANSHPTQAAFLADGGDPAPLPMPLPGAPKPPTKPPSFTRHSLDAVLTDGGDPAPLPMPLPKFADGGDPAPLPMPLPRFVADGGDPAPLPMPLPKYADGGDPAPLPMPLPGAPKPPTRPPSFVQHSDGVQLADGGDPAPLPMPLPRFADGGDPAPLPMPLPGAPHRPRMA